MIESSKTKLNLQWHQQIPDGKILKNLELNTCSLTLYHHIVSIKTSDI